MTSPGQRGPSRAARHLEQERGETLGRAEVGAVERVVGAQHADEREPREVVALRQHLRADKDVDLACVHALTDLGERAARPCRVAIDPRDPGRRKE